MQASSADPAFYRGAVLDYGGGDVGRCDSISMGRPGHQMGSVPVVAVPISVMQMDKGMGTGAGAAGTVPDRDDGGDRGSVGGRGSLAAGCGRRRRASGGGARLRRLQRWCCWGLRCWPAGIGWNVEAADYSGHIFKPAPTEASLQGNQLDLRVTSLFIDSRRGRAQERRLPAGSRQDHAHCTRSASRGWMPAFHLHPELVATGDFRLNLPKMPAGHYNSVCGDVVHASGLPETLVTSVDISRGHGWGGVGQ